MIKQCLAQLGRKSHCRLGCEKLRRNGRCQSHYTKEQQEQSHFTDIAHVPVGNTIVDDIRHYQRNHQFKKSFQQFEQRCQYGLFLVILQIHH